VQEAPKRDTDNRKQQRERLWKASAEKSDGSGKQAESSRGKASPRSSIAMGGSRRRGE
jgi:hypothetical protein